VSANLTLAAPSEPITPATPRQDRLESVDLLRGMVMILMALDHVRDFMSDRLFYDATNLAESTPANFLTRWITHYCAPTFIFLAGTGAFLSGTRGKSKPELSWFLLTRGLWLVLLELTVVRMSWMFDFNRFDHGPGVFWAIGWSMVVLSGLVYLPISFVTVFGLVMIGYHNLLDGLTAEQLGLTDWSWVILHQPGSATVWRVVTPSISNATIAEEVAPVWREITIGTGYCLIPWCGVMAAGYGFGALLRLGQGVRRRELFGLGLALTLAFILLRARNVYGDPNPWWEKNDPLLNFLSFLNCTKYPPSLLYLLMTLGPAILALALFDRPLGPWARPIITIGRVPLFYYLLHVPLIHGLAVLIDYVRYGWSPQAAAGPWMFRPGVNGVAEDYGISLPMVYLVWIGVVLVLYPACRWFAGVKQRRREAWLSYL